MVKFYEDPVVRGGDGLVIRQSRLNVPPRDECCVRAKGVNLKYVAMVLAGLGEGSGEEGKGAEGKDAEGKNEEIKKSSANWYSKLVEDWEHGWPCFARRTSTSFSSCFSWRLRVLSFSKGSKGKVGDTYPGGETPVLQVTVLMCRVS